MRSFEYNNPDLKKRRRDLRRNATEAEKRLWQRLKNKQMRGVRFLRQYSVGSYILDFYSPQKRLAIELDGGQHSEKTVLAYDQKRTKYLAVEGIKIVRFWNDAIFKDLNGVLEFLWKALD